MLAISVQGLGASLGGRVVLRDISLDVAAGEMVALIGPSGAGKTTLLRAMAGLLPSSGKLMAQDQPALVFQQHALASRLTARDNVLVGGLGRMGFWRAALRLWPRAEMALAEASRARVGLAGFGGRRADRLSGGQRQRVAIARATVMRPAVILADEPTGNLDRATGEEVVRLLEELNAQGVTLIVVTHDQSMGAKARRQVMMLDGAVASDSGVQ